MYEIRHAVTGQVVGQHKTKKAATAQADEMTQAHREIDARHDGHEVTFIVEKAPEPVVTPGVD